MWRVQQDCSRRCALSLTQKLCRVLRISTLWMEAWALPLKLKRKVPANTCIVTWLHYKYAVELVHRHLTASVDFEKCATTISKIFQHAGKSFLANNTAILRYLNPKLYSFQFFRHYFQISVILVLFGMCCCAVQAYPKTPYYPSPSYGGYVPGKF